MLTTCKHGSNWKELCRGDSVCIKKCESDNEIYNEWDYKQLLHNSTFCLVPRGRRLGSFRFIEVMEQGCIPIVMANGWVLPFSEKIDWSRAAINWDERLLIEFKDYIDQINDDTIFNMRQQAAFYYTTYFSSIDKIIQTTLEIIHDRVFPSTARSMQDWNTKPGALIKKQNFNNIIPTYGDSDFTHFTAVIHVTQADPTGSECRYPDDLCHGNVWNLIDALFSSKFCNEIIILWACETDPPATPTPVSKSKIIKIINDKQLRLSNKFWDRSEYSNQ